MLTADSKPVSTSQTMLSDHWFNLAFALPDRLAPPVGAQDETLGIPDLSSIYSEECARIELLEGVYGTAPAITIPGGVLDEYRKYRPTPLQRAIGLEKALQYPGTIHFKREDTNPTGSHKPNTAIPQAYYAKQQGLRRLVTDTGAGQWGCALAWACHNQGLECTVFMTRSSYQTKPYRRFLMELCGAEVISSPSDRTPDGRRLLAEDPDHAGSLGIGMGEAMTTTHTLLDTRLALGCMSYYAALHQTVIGLELREQLQAIELQPDVMVGCVGGGTNFVGFIAPFVAEDTAKGGPSFVAVESARIPVLTQGAYGYEHADAFGLTPKVKMYHLGRGFLPDRMHAGGLRYHGKSPILSLLFHRQMVSAVAVSNGQAFKAGKLFLEAEGILAAPESSHAIAHVVELAQREESRDKKTNIVFCLSGTGYLDLSGYSSFFQLP